MIESRLLFKTGEPVSGRLIEETERNLRELRHIREPSIRAVGCHDSVADIEVTVQEVWTTNPGISFGRSGGENTAGIKLEELNLLGLGKQLAFELAQDADRSFYTVHWRDPGVRDSRWITEGPRENLGLLTDVGFGLRLASSRSALGNVVHVDVAFPLDGSRNTDDVQFLVQTKRSF